LPKVGHRIAGLPKEHVGLVFGNPANFYVEWCVRRQTSVNRAIREPTHSIPRVCGLTLLEVLLSVFLLGGAILTGVAVLSRDVSLISRGEPDLVGQTALRMRVEQRRLQSFNAIFNDPLANPPRVQVGTCRQFTNDAGYGRLAGLPFGTGEECAQGFEGGASPRLHRLTVTTRVLNRTPNGPNDPDIHEFRTVMLVYQDGINRQ